MAEWISDIAVGQWFRTDGDPFEIVGVDAKAEIVLVQHFDGTLEEIEFEAWTQLLATPSAPPKDYSGALDIGAEDYGIERDELGTGLGHWDSASDLIEQHKL
ncbi:MAG TPA: DUF6763 family protein [Fontimonas sp.]